MPMYIDISKQSTSLFLFLLAMWRTDINLFNVPTVNAYLGLEGGDFLEMRIKHLEKVGEVEKALILTKACGNCSLLPNQATFRQTYVTQLCQQLPSEEAILEVFNSVPSYI